jgi:prolyl-tRNA editing enzyme YbaK/EbsC (Cys-tRNA(Pro) deacylase)
MHERVDEFVGIAAERYGLTVEPIEFPEKGTPTAADAAEAVDCEIGQIVNSLVFSVEGSPVKGAGEKDADPVLCLTSGANRVSEAAVAEWAGIEEAAVSMASPELVREATGWAIGGVPPLCHDTELPTLFDPTLLDYETVWAAAGTPTSMWAVAPGRLRDLADAETVDVTE